MSTTQWPTSRLCGVCGVDFFPKSTVQIYCTSRCREHAKYDRVRNDPARWSAYLARLRDNYEPKGNPPGPVPLHSGCSVDGCTAKHLARGFCRKHYRRDRYRRGLDRESPVELIAALVKHYDESGDFIEEPTPRRLVAKASAGLLVPECPDCGHSMFKLPNDSMDLRDCGKCRVRALLNSEEVSWLTSLEPSIERSRPTRNS